MAASTTEGIIYEALLARYSTLSFSPSIPLAYPGVPYTPTIGTRWLRASWLPASARAPFLAYGAHNEHRGIFQIDVFSPVSTIGMNSAVEVAGAVCAHFKRGTELTRNSVTVRIDGPKTPMPRVSMEEPNWLQISVDIHYLAFVANA